MGGKSAPLVLSDPLSWTDMSGWTDKGGKPLQARRPAPRRTAKRDTAPPARNMQTQGDGSRLTAGYDPVTDRFFRALGNKLGNQNLTENLRFIDNNLLNLSNAENAAFNFGRGEGTLNDAIDIAFAAPLAGVVAKPLGVVGRGLRTAARMTPGAERVANLATRVAQSRPVQYMTEARPVLDNADDAIETAFTVTPGAQRRITNQRPVVQGLPAPEQRLGLPAPGPGLPDYAAKPRGGQWWADESPYGLMNPAVSSKENIYLGARFSSDPTDKALADWWDKALPRYIQNDFATPDDPFRALADQGYLQGIENAAQWSNRVKGDIVPMPLQKLLFDPKTAETGVRDEALAAMPWVSKMPATDTIYGFWPREETVGALSHIRDEMVNALKPDTSGIPADLAVRPESLGRMSFAQAAERVGQINQWRAKQAGQAQLSALNNPAIHTFKEYAENNPMGLRWVELKTPAEISSLPPNWRVEKDGDGFSVWDPADPEWPVASGQTEAEAIANANDYTKGGFLQQALKYEGDTMGHCVGGYCDDVESGRSRIFSLRDAKGEPHVTIETKPRPFRFSDVRNAVGEETANQWLNEYTGTEGALAALVERAGLRGSAPEDIIQIKGKQNRAPKEDYLPFVQDFVKSGQWGSVGDFENTGLVRLPDGRYITQQQQEEAFSKINEARPDDWDVPPYARDLSSVFATNPHVWSKLKPYFEGYARGGRALAAKPCSCDHSFSVR